MRNPEIFAEVEFNVHATLQHGETVGIIGNCPSLGNMIATDAIRLITTHTTYPSWKTLKAILIPLKETIQYKYCIFSGGEISKIEKNKRTLYIQPNNLPEDLLIRVNESFNFEECTSDFSESNLDKETKTDHILKNHEESIYQKVKGSKILKKSSFISKESGKITIKSSDSVIVVSYFLPVIVHRETNNSWKVEWDNENLLSLKSPLRVLRIGTVRLHEKITSEDETAIKEALQPFSCIPIFLKEETHNIFYNVFCKGILWPVFHSYRDIFGKLQIQNLEAINLHHAWTIYTEVNKLFSLKVIECFNNGDFIWVHGFHLMVLPSFLQRRLISSKVGFFLHTPFPSSEIFRTLSFSKELLHGMLMADQIGFHLFEYVRHFLTCCRRTIGVKEGTNNMGNIVINVHGRTVAISCVHAGIDPDVIQAQIARPTFVDECERLKRQLGNRIIITDISKTEKIKGILLKLTAFGRFLEQYPEWQGRVVLYLLCMSASEREEDYFSTRQEIRVMVDLINLKYSTEAGPAIILSEKDEIDVRMESRLPLMAVADIYMTTAVRDGLNRLPFEYLSARTKVQKPGVLVLSNFSSCIRALQGAIHVNPWDVSQVVEAIRQAICMDQGILMQRFLRDSEFVQTNTTARWATIVLEDLKSVNKTDDPRQYSAIGFGHTLQMFHMDATFQSIDFNHVTRAYRKARRRLIYLDYGGTILPEEDNSDHFRHFVVATKLTRRRVPEEKTLRLISDLCEDSKNTVFVVSGKERRDLNSVFETNANVGLAAEHGFFYRWPNHGQPIWEELIQFEDPSWKTTVHNLMDIYTQRTNGTYIEFNESAIVWQFREADPDFGQLQSKELEDHLNTLLKGFPLEIIRGKYYLEVRPEGISKGGFLEYILLTMTNEKKPYDFCLCIGDDETDEDTFLTLKNFTQSTNAPKNFQSFSCTVGKKPSNAANYLHDTNEVIELLQVLNRVGLQQSKAMSSVDLRELCSNQNQSNIQPIQNYSNSLSSPSSRQSTSQSLPRSWSQNDIPSLRDNYSTPTTVNEYFATIDTVPEDDEYNNGIFF